MMTWIRIIFFISGVINMIGTLIFIPGFTWGRAFLGLPREVHPFYLWIIASWIFLFGVAYLSLSFSLRPQRLFLYIGALGKLFFGLLIIGYYLMGEVFWIAILAGLTDMTFAAIFLFWLYQTRHAV